MSNESRYLFNLARKNIGRNRGRSFFIGFSVALSVVMAVWILAFFDGMNHQIEQAVVQGNVGYWQLQEKAFADTTDPLSPRRWEKSIAQKLQHPSVLSYSPELVLDGYLSAPEGNAALQVVGVDFALHRKNMAVAAHIVQGRWPSQGERGIVIGQEIAQRFHLAVGDQLVVNFQDVKSELRSELVSVLGVYHHNGKSFENRYAYVGHELVYEFLFAEPSQEQHFHRIVVMSPNLPVSQRSMQNISQDLKLELRSWKQLNPEMGVVLDFHEGLMRFFFIIIAITVTVTILTPVSMLWQERLGEIRMMSIIGVPHAKVWRLGMFEATIMTLLSATAAALILIALISYHHQVGINFDDFAQGQIVERAGIQLPRTIFPLLLAKQIFVTYGFVILIMLMSYGLAVRSVLRKAQGAA